MAASDRQRSRPDRRMRSRAVRTVDRSATRRTRAAESPTGLGVSLVVPQSWENPTTLSTANLKDTTVTLPEGMTANPSLAAGLGRVQPATVRGGNVARRCRAQGVRRNRRSGRSKSKRRSSTEKIPGAIYIATAL